MTNILEMSGISKRFGSVLALDNIDFSVAQGEIHALLGVNGAGKSTLIKILSGIYTPDSGSIVIDGTRCEISNPADAIANGVASVQQHPELVDDFSGYENIFLGQEANKKGLFKRVDHRAMRANIKKLLGRFPVDIDLECNVQSLSGIDREIVAILHALKQDDIKILILDEPTSTLTRVEKVQLFQMMNTMRNSGVSIIYITHRLEEVFEIADRFTVFRGGLKVATLESVDAKRNAVSIASLMLQEEMGGLYPSKTDAVTTGTPTLAIDKLCLNNKYSDISFEVSRGEIVGIYGLVGSGIDELAKSLFGAIKPASGTIKLFGKHTSFKNPQQALAKGIFLVPGDRRVEGLVLSDDVTFNTTLANLPRASKFWIKRYFNNRKTVKTLASKVALSPMIINQPASSYSGGNQQKIVIAKGLYSQCDLYILVEPTIGVDVGARSTLYELIRELSKNAAVLVFSSDCDEIHGVSDRASAFYRGRLVAQPSTNISRETLLSFGIMGTEQ